MNEVEKYMRDALSLEVALMLLRDRKKKLQAMPKTPAVKEELARVSREIKEARTNKAIAVRLEGIAKKRYAAQIKRG